MVLQERTMMANDTTKRMLVINAPENALVEGVMVRWCYERVLKEDISGCC